MIGDNECRRGHADRACYAAAAMFRGNSGYQRQSMMRAIAADWRIWSYFSL